MNKILRAEDVLDTDRERAITIITNALTCTNWPKFVASRDLEIPVPDGAGRILNVSHDEIDAMYKSRDELLEEGAINVVDDPMLLHKLTLIRQKRTKKKDRERLVSEIASGLIQVASRTLPVREIDIETPICSGTGYEIAGKKPIIAPILRAGLGMYDGASMWLPASKVAHIGMHRNHETLLPVIYFAKVPEKCNKRTAFIIDPMLATGGSAVVATEILKSHGCTDIKYVSILAAPQGIAAMRIAHPDVPIFTVSVELGLTKKGYIVIGLGDMGDLLFGT